MAKRGYKLQEFVAHSGTVNCLKVGKKACRQFITGGDDHKVNLWTIGKPTSLMSLSGHSSPVESLAFDSAEVLVLAGASNGAIKLWDLEEAKMVRTLTGHRSSCTAVEFHPFGEFFASGSMDTNLRIWDIRKKGCIHTYKGHSQGVSTIKFTPDGRWVVSGGFDNVVKVWDLTAGKLLHDFTFHEGHIRSIDFHPLEFLLATGSADRTVKFWDLETFELIGSARHEATGVRSIAFHPDGRTLFTGLEDSLKVYSWEPVICHDSVDMGWTTLGDLCIHDGKLLGCSYYRNSVGIWVADISLIEPYSAGLEPKKNEGTEQKLNLQGSQLEKVETGLHSTSPDSESKEIKNIYVDSSGGKPVALKRSGSYSSPKVDIPKDSKEINNLGAGKQNPDTGHTKSNGQALKKSFILPNVVPRDTVDVKDSAKPGKETITFSRTKPGMLLKPAHVRRASTGRFDVDRFSADADSGNFGNTTSKLDNAKDPKLPLKLGPVEESCEDKYPIKSITDKSTKSLSPPNRLFEQEKCDESSPRNKETSPVKYINGVAVVRGRTRSLVERFERKEKAQINKEQTDASPAMICERSERVYVNENQTNAPISTVFERKERVQINKDQTDASPAMICERGERVQTNENQTNAPFSTVFERRENVQIKKDQTDASPAMICERRERVNVNENQTNAPFSTVFERREKVQIKKDQTDASPAMICERRERVHVNENQTNAPLSSRVFERREQIHINEDRTNTSPIPSTISENDKPATIQEVEPQISERESKCANEGEIIEGLMQTHDVTLSNFRSRLTKLQVVRHFWERRDFKGAINALRKLPDHSVQADVISVLVEKMEILTLDLFSYLLPVLTGLLDSKIERHVKISLDMLLKLVAVFGPTIHATTSAPPSVGVDLHAEQRRECCKQCFLQLQKIQKILPLLIRRGDILAKSAQELNLVLQQSY